MRKVFGSIFVTLLLVFLTACVATTTATTANPGMTTTTGTPSDTSTERTLVSLEVTTPPTKTVYVEGETFDPAGLVVTAHYSVTGGTSATADVTASVTYDKSVLSTEDDLVTVSYAEGGITRTATIALTVNPLGEPIGDGLILAVPTSDVVLSAVSTHGEAVSYWFAAYGAEAFRLRVVVADPSLEEGTSLFNSDGIEVSLCTTRRGSGILDGTLLLNISVNGELSVKIAQNGDFVAAESTGITAAVRKVSFGGTYVEGYQVEVDVPYAALGLSGMEKTVTLLPGLYNNQGSVAQAAYWDGYGADPAESHTFVLVSDDDVYAPNPWLQLGYTFGNLGTLETVDSWDLSGDDGTENAVAEMTTVTAGTDNNAYMYRSTAAELYAYAELSAKEVLNGELWGKFGIAVTTLDGADGFFFFVDAAGDGTNMTGYNVGIVNRSGNSWIWSSLTVLDSLTGADAYQEGNYVKFAVYRSGNIFEFFLNGESVGIKSGFPGLTAETAALASLASFNITLKAKSYGVTTEESVLQDLRFQTQDIENLFLGDSYVDLAFWTNFALDFPVDSVNVGVGGTKVAYWASQMATLTTLYNPKNIIIHIGVNDINDEGLEGTAAAERVLSLLSQIQTLFPESEIYYITIEPNNFIPANFTQYQIVNGAVEALCQTETRIHLIDMVTPLGGEAGTAVARYFGIDGLHLNADGYAVWAKTISAALGVERTATAGNLGDYEEYAHSSGWTFGEGVVENVGGYEQQIYFDGVSGTSFLASVSFNVQSVLNGDQYPKIGLALKGADKTLFFFFDVNQNLDNNWGNYVVRPSGADWQWGAIGYRAYVYLGSAGYNGDSFKTIEIARLGTALYFISDGRVVQYVEGVFAEDEITQLSVLSFNLHVQLKDATVYTDEALETRLSSYKIAQKQGSAIDGDLSDWDSVVLANAFHIYGTNGRTATIYGYAAQDGVYLAYDALFTGNYVTSQWNWWENTNVEFRLGTNNARYSSASGNFSRYEPAGSRDVGTAAWTTDLSQNLHRSIVEIFIPWSMIDGYSADSQLIPAGFAWKNPGEEGSIWAGGDFWYVPEADPGMLNVLLTSTGLYQPTDLTIDGSVSDWTPDILSTAWTGTSGTRQYSSVAWLGADGLYGLFTVQTADPLNLNTAFTAGDWWQNPNMEIWTNGKHSRIMFYQGEVRATGFINQVGYTYEETTHLLTVEFFISYHSLGLESAPASVAYRIGSNSLNGGWYMPVDPDQAVTETGLPARS